MRRGYLSIKCPRGGQAWLAPIIDVNKLPASTSNIEALEASKKRHAVWAAYFNNGLEAYGTQVRAVTSLSPEDLESLPWEAVKQPLNVENIERPRHNLQTPKAFHFGPLL